MNYTGFGINPLLGDNRPAAMYTFGGGTFPRDFQVSSPYMGLEPNTLYQTWEMGPSGPQLSGAAKKFGVQVLPAGATSRQQMRYLVEEAKRSGRPYVEAPEKFVRGDPKKRWGKTLDSERLYNARTGAPYSGTLMWVGGGWGGRGRQTNEEGVPITGGFNKKENLPSGSYSKTLGGWNKIPSIPFIGSFY